MDKVAKVQNEGNDDVLKFTPRDPDWSVWRNLPKVQVWQAVALSLGVDPSAIGSYGVTRVLANKIGPDLHEFRKRLLVAEANLGLSFMDMDLGRPVAGPKAMRDIMLSQFASWVVTTGWQLPDAFPYPPGYGKPSTVPRAPVTPLAASEQSVSAIGKSSAGVSVQLPHMTTKLNKLFEIMRRHWGEYDPDSTDPRKRAEPSQKEIGADLDEAFGWKPQDGDMSRNAATVVPFLRPDALSDADMRNPGARRRRR
jgi:hypothetical protein